MSTEILSVQNNLANSESKNYIYNGNKINLNKDGIPEELENSLLKIVTYSEIDDSLAKEFIKNIEKFKKLKGKGLLDLEIRNIKKEIESVFFTIYKNVLKKVIKENNNEKIYDMFLNYSYMDENLLTKEQVIKLYSIDISHSEQYSSNIYTLRQWLEAIYKSEREPSVNDFDLDYYDTFRELMKAKKIEEKEKNSYYKDQDRKIDFEINNFFKKTQRLCCGQMSLYFPILYSDMIGGDIEKAFISPQIVDENIKKILSIDFSLFHREIFCHDVERGLEKEYLMESVAPDIILIPTFGTKSVMWQPIAGKDKGNPGRFVIPLFSLDNLYDMIIKVCGDFRWELCKSVMGVAWADITQKSLTSEYSDYIQFYRKNNDLSIETKEKIRNQITKNRNMLRNIFSSDYILWIKYESTGAMRLNKVLRIIMSSYCPFSKQIREKLEKQVAFMESYKLYNISKNKKIKFIENKIVKLSKTRKGVPKELEEQLSFYKDM